MRKKLTIATYVFLFGIAIYGLTVDLSARFGAGLSYGLSIDAFILMGWLSLFYFMYDKLNLNFETYCFAVAGLISHIIGDLWLYGMTFGVVQFDMIQHGYWGFVLALLMHRYLQKYGIKKHPVALTLITLLTVLGLSAIHELIEFFGYYFLGEGPGLLMYGIGDFGEYNDLIWDFISNFIGIAVALAYVNIRK